ncbi:nuclear pore complex protein NUP98A [Macadamia integrifolia]|uniref:nuclear pore complex protein NUP98A n=1 Tax=Macadamia integrifolia TaxID=60698 RepID=UPI001C4FE4B8|nr:nuclear pore complex protein NUP98A [Macadamia integrifolia]XP_042490895.1 nuclear pore complex protein NUP98A [Macadamia integrifolia]
MFGSTNPFGQSSSSPFGSQSVFGQTNNASSNPFTPKPFGSTSPFGSQTGSSIFSGTSTGVFGATQSSSPLTSVPTFGAASSPAFGSSMPAFGASSTPAFGSSSSSFGGSSSVFGQKPAFGGFGSTPQTSPFGSTFQQTQPAFGSNLFGSTPFGASSQSAFGGSSTPAFGATSSPAFGATSSPAFGATSTPAFGSSTTPTFGSTGTAFGVSSSPAFGSGGAFGASSTPVFGASSTPAFGASSTPAFGASSTPTFGASNSPAFGSSSAPSFSFGSSPAFGQSSSAFGSSPFGTTPSPFGAQSSPFGSQATTPTFASSGFVPSNFGGQRGGSRVTPYTPTPEVDGGGAQPAGKLESISAMPVYKDKSHEELRWEDYQLGDKGGPNPAGQSAGGIGFAAPPAQSNPFAPSPAFGQSSTNPFSTPTSSNPFAPKTPAFGSSGFGTSSTPAFGSSPFGSSSTSNPFGSTSSSTQSLFGASSTPAFGASSSPPHFGGSTTSAFGSSSSIFGSASAPGTTSTFGSGLHFGNTQTTPLFQSTTPSLVQAGPAFGQTTSAFGQNTASSFGQSSIFSKPSTGFGGNLFPTTPSLLNSSNPVGYGQTTSLQPSQTSSAFSFGNIGQTQPGASSGFGGVSSVFGQGAFGQLPATQGSMGIQPVSLSNSNPFGTLPAMPQMSIGRTGSAPSIQYGISSMPVTDKPAPVRVSSLLTSRHLSQRRMRLPVRKYHPKNDGPKVPFYSDDEEAPSTPKADALFIPRENPRALVIRPTEQWPSKASVDKVPLLKDTNNHAHENGKISGDVAASASNGAVAHDKDSDPSEGGTDRERTTTKINLKANGVHDDHSTQKGDSYITLTGHRAGEAAIVYEHGADIEALMPKLRHSDYYTEPRIQELAAKERAEPGFCRRVKDFVVGRHGYGSIKFIGETDVRRLDLESLVQFNHREVIVYMDESKKPPVGQGLNKPAEVTLLNIKCFDKKTGQQYTEGPKVEKYEEMLKKKAQDQGAEFVSYDSIEGEWKFRVSHFSRYKLQEDDCNSD